ncbi:UNVERIFIED_CONTAM: hypothetical protein Sindi_0431200 [Sesamum indicum]
MGDVGTLKGSLVHVLEEHLNFPIVIEEIVAFDDVRVVDIAKDLDFAAHLNADGVVVVAIDDFEGVEFAGGSVKDFVDGAAGTATDATDAVELGVFKGLGRGGGGGSGGGGRGRGTAREGSRWGRGRVRSGRRRRLARLAASAAGGGWRGLMMEKRVKGMNEGGME